jgi:hypothetical protein
MFQAKAYIADRWHLLMLMIACLLSGMAREHYFNLCHETGGDNSVYFQAYLQVDEEHHADRAAYRAQIEKLYG